jgi:hypothetical protein
MQAAPTPNRVSFNVENRAANRITIPRQPGELLRAPLATVRTSGQDGKYT